MALASRHSPARRFPQDTPARLRGAARRIGPGFATAERFTVGTVTHLPDGSGAPVVERAVLAAPGQLVELLPGWVPLAS